MDLQLTGKVALVTGGSKGLGAAICRALAAEGARVAVNYHRQPELAEALAGELGGLAVPGDVADAEAVAAAFDAVEATFGVVDILINNAAVCPVGPLVDTDPADWQRAMAVNCGGAFLCCAEFVRRLRAVGRAGRIVNVSSQAAWRGSQSGKAAYDASKGALNALTVSLARELAAEGFGVNGVAPGFMDTAMLADALAERRAEYEARVPLRRLARLEEVADVVAFLASPRASYMTGATVDVSGGLAMH